MAASKDREMDDEKRGDRSEEEPKQAGGSFLDNKIILMSAIILAQALLAIGMTMFVIVPKLERIAAVTEAPVVEVAKPQKVERKEGVIVGLNEVVVSLRDSGPTTSYLRINIDLEVADAKVAATVATRLPHLRDIVILALSNKTAGDLRSMDGKAALKAELQRKLGEVLPEDGLWDIYFSDMVVQ